MQGNIPHTGDTIISKVYMKSLLQKFQDFGVSGREAELYMALLQKKEFTAPEVAKMTSVSRTKCYEILQNLVKKRICTESFKNGMKYFSAIKPSIAIQNLLGVYENELAMKKEQAKAVELEMMQLYASTEKMQDPMDYIEVLTDPGQIRERWFSIQESTSRELIGFTKPPYTKALNDNFEFESLVLKRNVLVKSVYEYQDLETREDRENLAKVMAGYSRIGEEVRAGKELPMKLVISDESITMFALNDRVSLKPSITTMIVNHPSFAMAMKKVFESYWNSSLTLEEYVENIVLTDLEVK